MVTYNGVMAGHMNTVAQRKLEPFASWNTTGVKDEWCAEFYTESEEGNTIREPKQQPVSRVEYLTVNDWYLGDLNLKTDISRVHALLFTSIHVVSITDFQ